MNHGVFETIRVREGQAPLLDRHAIRLLAACRVLRLPVPDAPLDRLVAPWLEARDCVVRLEVGPTGCSVTTRATPPLAPLDVIVAATPHASYPLKVTDRGTFAAAQAEALAAGADDALLLTADGLVAEGTAWSVFWWEADQLATPPLALGVLPGVARARVAELAPVAERERSPSQLVGRVLFATNAVRGVVPIARLDGRPIPEDRRTARLAERFWPDRGA